MMMSDKETELAWPYWDNIASAGTEFIDKERTGFLRMNYKKKHLKNPKYVTPKLTKQAQSITSFQTNCVLHWKDKTIKIFKNE